MRAHDLRNLSTEELAARVREMQANYFATAEAVRLGKEQNHAQLRELKADIARARTVLREKQD